jgi:hypothetical protein
MSDLASTHEQAFSLLRPQCHDRVLYPTVGLRALGAPEVVFGVVLVENGEDAIV